MWIALIIGIILLLIIRGIYKSTGKYQVYNSRGEVLHWGSWDDCLKWTKEMNSIGLPEKFLIKRV